MLRSHLFLATLIAAGSLSLGLVACGDDSGVGGAGGGAPSGANPPARPEGAGPGDGTGKIFGTSHLYIGTKTRAGAVSADAWKDFGYDLDGQITGSDFANHCTPAGGAAPTNVFPDGTNGVDNAFGKVLLPIIKTAAATSTDDLEASLNGGLTDGTFNLMINITDLGDGANYDPLNSILLAGKEGVGNTWKVVPEFLTDTTDPLSSKVKFPSSYMNANTWVSGDKGLVSLSLAIAGFELELNIDSALISMELDAAHGTASNGIIAGVIDAEAFIDQLRDVLGAVDVSFCEGTAVEGILNQIRQASDIMADGSQQPGVPCTGISIGLGFDTVVVTLDGVGTPADPVAPPCSCGNDMIDVGETCDDGNTTAGDGCDGDCQIEGGEGGAGGGG